MDDERVRLGQDLAKKLDALFAVYEQPIVRVDGYFSDLRNQIDFEAEGLLERFETGVGDAEQVESCQDMVNSDRERYIAILKEIEAKIVKQLPTETRRASEAYASLKQRVEEFKTAAEVDISALEDNYVRLALEIMDETNELERQILGNQTVIFSSSKYEMKLGPLIHLTDDFLSQDEIEALMSISYFMVRMESIHELLDMMLNRRLLVGTSRPFNLTKKMIVMERLDCILMSEKNKERLDGQYWRFENSRIQIQDPEPDTGPAPHRSFSLGVHTYRLPSLAAELAPFFEHIVELQIANNDLESLNEALLAKCISLRELQLLNFCQPETKFGIGFLASLSNLEKLELTLPDLPLDFGVLECLVKLDNLRLEGSSRMDAAREHSKMAANAFKQLIDLPRLRGLALAFFEIEATNQDLFKHSLQTLELANVKLLDDALEPSSNAEFDSELDELTLSKSRITQLPVGAFNRLVNLETLNLSHNHIRKIKQGVFSELEHLSNLNLNNNPIESIENGAFTLPNLLILSLNKCRLRSINGQMFAGLVNLEVLELENNEIETIEAAADVQFGKSAANTTPEQLAIVKASLFRDLEMLRRLSLKGNRLEKLDFNWFYNLKDLYCLDVSFNLINELNESTAPGTLSDLAELNLANNRLVSIDKKTLAPFGELKKFFISQNPLERIDLSFLAGLQHLRILHLQDTRLQMTIAGDTFAPPQRFISSLVELDIRNNEARVEPGAFRALPKLEKLRMNMSALAVDSLQDAASWKSVPFFGSVPTLMQELVLQNMSAEMRDLAVARFDVSSYYPAYRLTKLSLVKCALKTLHGFGWEKNFSLLTHLDVSGNLLETIEVDSFGHMSHLSSFNLADNLIETLDDPTLFEKLPRLQELNLSGNRLKSIRRGVFQGPSVDLRSLDLSKNALVSVDHGLFRGLRSLAMLDLSGNGISSLDLAKLFELCQRLQTLRLSHNQLDHRAVNEAAMSGAFRLTELVLASNRLENMHFVGALRKLRKLDLSDNRIASTAKDGVSLLGRLTSLTHLDLSGNRLETPIDEATLARLKPNLAHLDLSRNPATASLTE